LIEEEEEEEEKLGVSTPSLSSTFLFEIVLF